MSLPKTFTLIYHLCSKPSLPLCSPRRSVFSLISQHCPTRILQPTSNQASGPCRSCPLIPSWAAFPLPFPLLQILLYLLSLLSSKANFLHDKKIKTLHHLTPALLPPLPSACPKHQATELLLFPKLTTAFKSLHLCSYHHSALLSLLFQSGTLLLQDHLKPLLWSCSNPPGRVSLLCPLLPRHLPPSLWELHKVDCEYLGQLLLPCHTGSSLMVRSVF